MLADEQTAGRGSRGRDWVSPPGNLYLSVLLRPGEPAGRAGEWAILAAVALAEALAPHIPKGSALTLKWPNDILLDGRKLAGILLDAEIAADVLVTLVIGFGANLVVAPELSGRVAAVLRPAIAPSAVAAAVLGQLDVWRDIRVRHGFAAVRTAWLSRAPSPGTPMTLVWGAQTAEGAFAGLAEDGSVRLATRDGIRTFAAGEVLLPCFS